MTAEKLDTLLALLFSWLFIISLVLNHIEKDTDIKDGNYKMW